MGDRQKKMGDRQKKMVDRPNKMVDHPKKKKLSIANYDQHNLLLMVCYEKLIFKILANQIFILVNHVFILVTHFFFPVNHFFRAVNQTFFRGPAEKVVRHFGEWNGGSTILDKTCIRSATNIIL